VKLTELVGRPVLDLATATTIGTVDDAVVDPATRRLVGFDLRKTPGKVSWLGWDQVKAVGADAVTVPGLDAVTERPTDGGRLLRGDKVIGGRVLTDQGVALAHLADVDIDPATGQVDTLLLLDGAPVPAGDLLGIGTYATVVRAPAA
jgi:sporulation protein YlmC with PRC-barrel domain